MQSSSAFEIRETVRAKVDELVRQTNGGRKPPLFDDDTPLMATGLLDSVATIDLTVWIEENFTGEQQSELSSEKHGTINRITATIIESQK